MFQVKWASEACCLCHRGVEQFPQARGVISIRGEVVERGGDIGREPGDRTVVVAAVDEGRGTVYDPGEVVVYPGVVLVVGYRSVPRAGVGFRCLWRGRVFCGCCGEMCRVCACGGV